MIEYDFGTWGVGFIFSMHGSVFPRAMSWALPAGMLTALYQVAMRVVWGPVDSYPDIGGTSFTVVWGGFTFIVGFLMVFRTQIAFSRFWEGAKILWYVRGVWLNAVSNLISFTTQSAEKKVEVEAFQHFLARLMSLLLCTALESVAPPECNHWLCLGVDGIDREHLEYLSQANDGVEVVLNWVQRLIIQNHTNGVLSVPPPILSRVFQELGNGIREFQGARRIQQYPFPFPYAQAITFFLLLQWACLPLISAYFIHSPLAAATLTFCTIFAVWSINYIAAELEMPFGSDANDLPLHDMQREFNESLRMLLHPMTASPPKFKYEPELHRQMTFQKPVVKGDVAGEWAPANIEEKRTLAYTVEPTSSLQMQSMTKTNSTTPKPNPPVGADPEREHSLLQPTAVSSASKVREHHDEALVLESSPRSNGNLCDPHPQPATSSSATATSVSKGDDVREVTMESEANHLSLSVSSSQKFQPKQQETNDLRPDAKLAPGPPSPVLRFAKHGDCNWTMDIDL
eukprot:TRINITY_DN5151_c0_g1_i2.p1 TRINITY_DN5151_c0_g1~~TRINITY_DN5151_c0_g1_i2.p1  ORF type:complete len:514 (+),score=54.01 TRINITY_DN5151_c0_g1_i2:116-1657(+)